MSEPRPARVETVFAELALQLRRAPIRRRVPAVLQLQPVPASPPPPLLRCLNDPTTP